MWVTAVFYLCPLDVVGNDDDDGHSEAVSLLNSYRSCLDAIQRYDVFYRNDSIWFPNEGEGIEERVAYVRLVMDPTKKRCLAIQRVIKKRLAGTLQGAIDQPSESITAIVFSDNECWFRHIPQTKPTKIEPTKIEPSLDRALMLVSEVSYFHLLGFADFPMPYMPGIEKAANEEHSAFRAGVYKHTYDGKNRITARYARQSEFLDIEFDVINFVPKSIVLNFIAADHRVIPHRKERYLFENRDGLRLPLKISGERREQNVINQVNVKGNRSYNVDFKWFSVNEALDEKQFSFDVLRDPKLLLALVSDKVLNSDTGSP